MNPADVVLFMVRRVCLDSVPPTAPPPAVVPSVGAVALVLCIVLAVLLLAGVFTAASDPAAGHEDRAAAP